MLFLLLLLCAADPHDLVGLPVEVAVRVQVVGTGARAVHHMSVTSELRRSDSSKNVRRNK